ncbi:MAG: cyanophycinase [Paracoccus sp. (in: a-proteobacteria)]|uniref:cyanophycinase n=1 Tax=Paracoccus sp. TaxID=267 RepID=UPI0039E4E1AF
MTINSDNPKLAVIGGRLEDDNDAIYAQMHRLSGGRILVFPTASGEPEAVGAETVAVFAAHGFDAAMAPVHGAGAAQAARDPAIAALVADYGSVFFTGGDQALITGALAPGGAESPVLAAIRAAHAAGGLIAGSSAGAAVMSDVMIEGGTSLEAATYGVVRDADQPGMLLGRGLGFFPWGVVDQHFIKRGRFGRLVVALAESGVARGFGIDENTALFVDGDQARVIGEFGAFVLDMTTARIDPREKSVDEIGFTYLDDGDALDLATGEVRPGPDKRPVGARDIAYRAPARSLRNVFGAYTLYDLLARLVLGDPQSYASDRARAIEPKGGCATTVEFARAPGSRALMSERDRDFRMTAVGFRASMGTRRLSAAQLAESHRSALARDYGLVRGPQARLMLLGSSPLRDGSALLDQIAAQAQGPVGIIAAASADPRTEARGYARALEARGIAALDFGITIDNVERLGRDAELVERIAGLKTILLTGGNQIRLIETLLHRGEVTPILLAIARAHAAGGVVIAVSGAASALSGFMIGGGTSYEALRFGIASDMGRRGLVIQEGLGLFGAAIVDQNLDASRRLGRLAVACAEEGVRHGLGLLENSGVIANHDGSALTVIGTGGAVLVEIDLERTELQGDDFTAPGTRLAFAAPGDVIDLGTCTLRRAGAPELAAQALDALVADVIEDCCGFTPGDPRGQPAEAHILLDYHPAGDGTGQLNIQSIRDRHG